MTPGVLREPLLPAPRDRTPAGAAAETPSGAFDEHLRSLPAQPSSDRPPAGHAAPEARPHAAPVPADETGRPAADPHSRAAPDEREPPPAADSTTEALATVSVLGAQLAAAPADEFAAPPTVAADDATGQIGSQGAHVGRGDSRPASPPHDAAAPTPPAELPAATASAHVRRLAPTQAIAAGAAGANRPAVVHNVDPSPPAAAAAQELAAPAATIGTTAKAVRGEPGAAQPAAAEAPAPEWANLSGGRGEPSSAGNGAGAGAAAAERTADEDARLTAADRVRLVQRVARAVAAARPEGEVRLRLRPPELGSLLVRVRTEEGAVAARIETDTAHARALLTEHLPELRERLAELNLRVERFEVEWRGPGGERQSPFAGHSGGQSRPDDERPHGALKPLRPVPPPGAPLPGRATSVHRGDLDLLV